MRPAEVVDLTGRWQLWPAPELRLWRAAMSRALSDVDPSLRPPPGGDTLLREQIAQHAGVPMAEVVVTAGVRVAVPILVRGCTAVVLERPTFLGLARALEAAALPVHTLEWERLADAPSGSAICFTAPCRNPDGRTPDTALLQALERAATRGHTVICNSAYEWFAPPFTTPPGIVRVATLHKLAGPGACLGWAIAVEQAPATVQAMSLHAPPLHWQRAWGYFLRAGGLSLLRRRHAGLDTARASFAARIGAAGMDGAGPHLLLQVPPPEDVAVRALAAAGVLVSPGSAFAADMPSVRVCLLGLTVSQAEQAADTVARVLRRLSVPVDAMGCD